MKVCPTISCLNAGARQVAPFIDQWTRYVLADLITTGIYGWSQGNLNFGR